MESLKEQILKVEPDFFNNLSEDIKIFAKEIRRELRNEGHVVIGITGYPGVGKSNIGAVIGCLIDEEYDFEKNICYIPTSKQITEQYHSLKRYSYLHIDEATRGLHKHKWHDAIQQKLNELYDTEREGHFLCTALIMPRFQNFTENFRNFMIKFWIDIPAKGIALFYKKDEDKDCKDPWHLDESYKKKKDKWMGKRVFERTISDRIRAEQITACYWFSTQIPPIPKEVWNLYQELKRKSRDIKNEEPEEIDNYNERRMKAKIERWTKVSNLLNEGKRYSDIAAILGVSIQTITRDVQEMKAYKRQRGIDIPLNNTFKDKSNINKSINDEKFKIPEEFNKI